MRPHWAKRASVAIALSLGMMQAAWAATFTVNNAGSGADAIAGNGVCATLGGVCTLEAAIAEASALGGTHTIRFASSITAVTLTSPLPLVQTNVTLDGTNAGAVGGRVDLNGNGLGGLQFFGADGSTVQNLVIRNFSGNGLSLSGHGYTVTNCYIGVTPTGDAASPNSGNGIDVTGTIVPPSIPNLPPDFDFTPAQIAAQLGLLFASIPPNTFTLNVLSGNNGAGIALHGDKTAMNVVSANFIGTSSDGMSAITNGNSGIGAQPGVKIDSNAYANVIGPGNVISGNNMVATDNGIDAISNAVEFPNFIVGNAIGLGADPSGDIGNGGSGIKTDTWPEVDGNSPDNLTNYSLFIIGNNIADNKGANSGGLDSINGPNAGIAITGNSARVKATGNLIGLGSFGGVLSLLPGHGNAGDGIFVSTSDHEIGGSTAADFNVIAANSRHGILIAGTGTTDVVVRNNFIGVPDPTMLDILDLGNGGDGIHIAGASSNTIGGPGDLDDNVIAANGRHGVAMRNGATNNGWANLLQRNQIYANTGLGIDLERNLNAPDPIPDPLGDPNTTYANQGQNQPWICSQQPAVDPAACAAAELPSSGAGGTTVSWTLSTRANANLRIEFFARAVDGQTFLGEELVTADATGLVTGPNCVAGLCTSTAGAGIATDGMLIEMTATDLTDLDVPPVGDGFTGPANDTSEFSNAVAVAAPLAAGQLEFSAPVYTVNEGIVTATISVNRVNGADGAVTVDFATADGTAVAPADYTATASPPSLAWADQDAAPKTFTVSIAGDLEFEPGGNETVQLALANPTGGAALGSTSTAVLEIVDDDAMPTVSITDVSALEGDVGVTTSFDFEIMLSNPSSQTVTVVANTTAVSATSGTDFAPVTNQIITFLPGTISQTLTVDVIGDAADETPSEAFTVDLSTPVNATIADGEGLGTIVDDETSSLLTIDNVTRDEGNVGTTAFTFTITRSQTNGPASVDFATSNGTATAGVDYQAASGTAMFADGAATAQFTVIANADVTFEANETFILTLSNPSPGTTIGQGTGTGTITNDDGQPTISIADVSLAEGDSGITAFDFAVTLSNPSKQAVTVVANTANGSAVSPGDYTDVTAQTITFAPGQISRTLTVDVIGENTPEPPNETFIVNLSSPANATLADGQATGTIVDDDSGSVFTIANAIVTEGNAGTATLSFNVMRSDVVGTATVQFATSDGTATASGNDYDAATGTLTFASGIAMQTAVVTVHGDTMFEGNETLTVTLSNPSAGTSIGQGTATGTITNDDAQPTISVGDVTAAEGDSGTTAFAFTVSLSNPSSQTITVDRGTGSGSATAGSDYTPLGNQTITFAPGTTTQTVTVDVLGDTTVEADETFVLAIYSPTNATVLDDQGTGTIVDDDSGAGSSVFSIASISASEGDAGSTVFTFTVTRSDTSGPASVDYATVAGTATGSDFAATSGALSFAAGVATQTFTVTVFGDTIDEANEAFSVVLSNPIGGTIGQGTATATIVDDDSAVGGGVEPIATPALDLRGLLALMLAAGFLGAGAMRRSRTR